MSRLPLRMFAMAAALFAAPALRAQASATKGAIPESHFPPPGMCRVWVDGVPADKQPASTDCATALKNRPTNGRVIFGEAKAPSGGATRSGVPQGSALNRGVSTPTRPGLVPLVPSRTSRDSVAKVDPKKPVRDSSRARRDSLEGRNTPPRTRDR